MSKCIESSSSEDDASCNVKPKHVRRLKFGESILELDVANQPSISDRTLVFDQNVFHIPCTEKREYVRMWLETQKNDVISNDDLIESSPVPGTSSTKESPVLASSRKRSRRKSGINRHATLKKVNNVDSRENIGRSAICMLQSNLDHRNKEENENQQKDLSETRCDTPPCADKVAGETSPVLNIYYKEKRKKLQQESENDIPSKHLKLDNNKVASTNINPIIELDNNHSILKEISVDYDKLEENVDGKIKTVFFLSETKKSSEEYRQIFLPLTQDKLNFEDSSSNNTDKKIPNIEIDTSDNSEDDKYNELSNVQSSSNNNLSNLIEDTDTQETAKISQLTISNKSLIPLRQPFPFLQAVSDVDKIYSEAETIRDENTPLSAKISQIPSFSKTTQQTNSKSIQSNAIISTITTPSKKSPDKNIYAHLLDSGKKHRKPKKKSMVAKLQSLISAQVSNIRIWRHLMNKEHNATARFIIVFVRNCIKQFGNQFLEGTLMEDSFNLLQCDIEETESHNVQTRPKEFLHKNITIMLVCDIVGTLKMMSGVVINVYPPWNILDKHNLILEATYISINNDCEVPDIIRNKKKTQRKKRIIKEFNCPCIEQGRDLPYCPAKFNNDKPDVMEQIFDF